MKRLICLVIGFVVLLQFLNAQKSCVEKYFKIVPASIEYSGNGVQQYNVSLKWQNLDALSGTIINCNWVQANYFVGLEGNRVGWKDVRIGQIPDFESKPENMAKLPSFDSFAYQALDTSFLSESFYSVISPQQRDLARWLVSDAVQMQGLAWYVFDSLSYNHDFNPKMLNNYDIKFEDWVTFTSRYQKLKWTGIAQYNDEICAIVKFESYHNPLSIDNNQMSVKGRSLYYGEIWISLTDKQVEYACMFEDVVMKLTNAIFPDGKLIDLQREIIFRKQQ